ncbi:MAG: hypothetical protein JST01_03390 [Cyanobacteria bacterium SZAS TMP-1]|nr:hypothetical protein [Cyanobacteria bacterium SZAS TMP-1]
MTTTQTPHATTSATNAGDGQATDHSPHLPEQLAHYPLFHVPGVQDSSDEPDEKGYNPFFSGNAPLIYGDGNIFTPRHGLDQVTMHESPHGHPDDIAPDPVMAAAMHELSMTFRFRAHPTAAALGNHTPEFDIDTGKVTWVPDDETH